MKKFLDIFSLLILIAILGMLVAIYQKMHDWRLLDRRLRPIPVEIQGPLPIPVELNSPVEIKDPIDVEIVR